MGVTQRDGRGIPKGGRYPPEGFDLEKEMKITFTDQDEELWPSGTHQSTDR